MRLVVFAARFGFAFTAMDRAGNPEFAPPQSTAVLPLVLKGKQGSSLIGASIHQPVAFTCADGKTHALLFQADEINGEGRVVPNGPNSPIPRDDTPAVLEENDEFVLMLWDVEGACPEEELQGAKGQLFEVKVEVSYLKEPGGIYRLVAERGYVPSCNYVQYYPAKDQVKTFAYDWHYMERNQAIYDYRTFADLRHCPNQDVFDRLKVRFEAPKQATLFTSSVDVRFSVDYTDLRGTRVSTASRPDDAWLTARCSSAKRSSRSEKSPGSALGAGDQPDERDPLRSGAEPESDALLRR